MGHLCTVLKNSAENNVTVDGNAPTLKVAYVVTQTPLDLGEGSGVPDEGGDATALSVNSTPFRATPYLVLLRRAAMGSGSRPQPSTLSVTIFILLSLLFIRPYELFHAEAKTGASSLHLRLQSATTNCKATQSTAQNNVPATLLFTAVLVFRKSHRQRFFS